MMNKSKNLKFCFFALFLLMLFLTPNILAGDNPFNLPDLSLKQPTSMFYPKQYPLGTSFFIGDSGNYCIIGNRGLKTWGALYTLDSLIVTKDAYVRQNLYLDTNGTSVLQSMGFGLYLINNKDYGSQLYYIGELNCAYYWFKTSGATSMPMMELDTSSGLTVKTGGITISTSTATFITPSITIDNSATGKEITGIGQLGALVATVTVSTSSVQSNSTIIITPREQIAGSFYVNNINSGTSFDVSSTDPADIEKTFSWFIINLK